VVVKNVNSAFIGTTLEQTLREYPGGVPVVVLAGLTGNHCVNTTARMAGNLGFETYVAAEAVGCFERQSWSDASNMISAAEVKRVSLSNIHGEFCTVAQMEEILKLIEK
jgi:nicotinamidase-related amidase